MDPFNLSGISPIQKTYILRKLDSFQLSLLQGTLVYYTYMDYNHDKIRNFIKIEGAP